MPGIIVANGIGGGRARPAGVSAETPQGPPGPSRGPGIAELSAHLDAATARLLDLIRKFDAGGGWNTGFRSCAAWLTWRVGLDPGAARERVRVASGCGRSWADR
jgi:hypothetical protein